MAMCILLPVHPEWMCEILNGDKGIDVRKNAPKEWVDYLSGKTKEKPKPMTGYLYCTKDKKNILERNTDEPFDFFVLNNKKHLVFKLDKKHMGYNGKLLAKFTLEEVERIETIVTQEGIYGGYEEQIGTDTLDGNEILKESCMSREEFYEYLDCHTKKKVYGYAWHISNLEIFDEPKELSSLKNANLPNPKKIKFASWTSHYYWFLGNYTTNHGQRTCSEIVKAVDDLISVKRAPQSWCYVSDGELDKIWL